MLEYLWIGPFRDFRILAREIVGHAYPQLRF